MTNCARVFNVEIFDGRRYVKYSYQVPITGTGEIPRDALVASFLSLPSAQFNSV